MTKQTLLAIYFRMGMYDEGDSVSSDLIGFDCPFDDSPVLYAQNEEKLEQKIKKVHDSGDIQGESDSERDWGGVDWRDIYPDIICDAKGERFKQNYTGELLINISIPIKKNILLEEKH